MCPPSKEELQRFPKLAIVSVHLSSPVFHTESTSYSLGRKYTRVNIFYMNSNAFSSFLYLFAKILPFIFINTSMNSGSNPTIHCPWAARRRSNWFQSKEILKQKPIKKFKRNTMEGKRMSRLAIIWRNSSSRTSFLQFYLKEIKTQKCNNFPGPRQRPPS